MNILSSTILFAAILTFPVSCLAQDTGFFALDNVIQAVRSADYAVVSRANDIFVPYPDQHRAEQARDKAKRGLYKDLRCTVWFSKYDVDIYRLHTIISRAVFLDGQRAQVPLNWVGTFNDMPESGKLNEWLSNTGLRPAMIQARFAGRLLVVVYHPIGLQPAHVIHEALHFYFGDDDERLAGRLGVEVTDTDTTAISREVARHCKF